MFGQKKILLVEDEADLVELVKNRLHTNNYEVTIAQDGQEALDIIEKDNFDLIILDIMLPKINGFEVCKSLKENPAHKNIPVIMFTARADQESQDKSFDLGADAYIIKPFEPTVLLYKIKNLLEKKS